jgi:hypothetical protein
LTEVRAAMPNYDTDDGEAVYTTSPSHESRRGSSHFHQIATLDWSSDWPSDAE